MPKKLLKKHFIKIPKNIVCYFCNVRNFLLIKGEFGLKIIKLKVQIHMFVIDNLIFVTKNYLENEVCFRKKKLNQGQAITKTLIKKAFLDVSRLSYKKLKLVGVGFKVMLLDYVGMSLLKLDVGYSHSFYYKVPEDILIKVTSPTRFIVYGYSSDRVGEVSSQIRRYKIPDSYKGKGILYDNEEVILKEGKKT